MEIWCELDPLTWIHFLSLQSSFYPFVSEKIGILPPLKLPFLKIPLSLKKIIPTFPLFFFLFTGKISQDIF